MIAPILAAVLPVLAAAGIGYVWVGEIGEIGVRVDFGEIGVKVDLASRDGQL